eukprot:5283943-Pleurochrysis_carterae.AAC.4
MRSAIETSCKRSKGRSRLESLPEGGGISVEELLFRVTMARTEAACPIVRERKRAISVCEIWEWTRRKTKGHHSGAGREKETM